MGSHKEAGAYRAVGKSNGGGGVERRGRSLSSGRGKQGGGGVERRVSKAGQREGGKPGDTGQTTTVSLAQSGGSGSTAGTKVGSGASLKVPPPGVIENDDNDYDSDDSDFVVLNDVEEEAEEEIEEKTKKYFRPPRNYVKMVERIGINSLSTCEARHYWSLYYKNGSGKYKESTRNEMASKGRYIESR